MHTVQDKIEIMQEKLKHMECANKINYFDLQLGYIYMRIKEYSFQNCSTQNSLQYNPNPVYVFF